MLPINPEWVSSRLHGSVEQQPANRRVPLFGQLALPFPASGLTDPDIHAHGPSAPVPPKKGFCRWLVAMNQWSADIYSGLATINQPITMLKALAGQLVLATEESAPDTA